MTTIFPLYDWHGGGDGTTWNDPNNWVVTAANDDGMLFNEIAPNPPDASDTVDFTIDATITDSGTAGDVVGEGPLTVDGGSITAIHTFHLFLDLMVDNGGSITAEEFTSNTGGTSTFDNGTLTTSKYLEIDGAFFVNDGSKITASGDDPSIAVLVIQNDGSLTLDGSSLTTSGGGLTVGYVYDSNIQYGSGALVIENGSTVTASEDDPADDSAIEIGYNTVGTVTVTGSGSSLTTTDGNVAVGLNGGTGTLQIEGGATANFATSDFNVSPLTIGNGATGIVTVSGKGSNLTTSGGGVTIGFESGESTLDIESGATADFTTSDPSVAALSIDAGASVTVNGDGSDLSTSGGGIIIGVNGTGALNIEAGASVEAKNSAPDNYYAVDVASFSGSTGTVTIDGTGSTFTVNAGGLSVGDEGVGSITVSNGGTLNSTDTTYGTVIGASTGSTGTIDVTGDGSTFKSAGPIIVGENATGTLTIEKGASLNTTSDTGYVSVGSAKGSNGTLNIQGANTTAEISSALIVGDAGTGSLQLTDKASLTVGDYAIIGNQTTGNGYVFVGTDATFSIANDLVVGLAGEGKLMVLDGSTFTYGGDTLVLGEEAGSLGTVVFQDAETTINYSGALIVGQDGGGQYDLDNGISTSNSDVTIGENEGSQGIVTLGLLNGETNWTITGDLTDGQAGTGDLDLKHGDTVNVAGDLVVGAEEGSKGTIELDAPAPGNLQDALLKVSGAATIGQDGSGSLSLHHGSIASFQGGLTLADGETSTATMSLDGNSSVIAQSEDITIGQDGSATVSVKDGGFFNAAGSSITLGSGANGYGEIDVDGIYTDLYTGKTGTASELDVNDLTIGGDGTGFLKVTNGGIVRVNGKLDTGNNTGSIEVDSGSSLYVDGNLELGESASFSASGKDQGTKVTISGDLKTGAKSLLRLDDAGVLIEVGGDAQFVGTQLVNDDNELHVSGTMTLSPNNGDTDLFTATDAGTQVVVDTDVKVGDGGSAEIDVLAGASVSDGGDLSVGGQAGSNGLIKLSGDGSTWIASNAATVGDAGTGEIDVLAGASFTADDSVTLGDQSGSTGTVLVDGDGSTFDAPDMTVGGSGTGIVAISNGGSLEVGDLTIGDEASGNGTVTVADGDSSLTVNGSLEVGNAGKGQLTVDGDSTVGGDTTVGSEAGSSGHITVNVASLELDGKTTIGESGSGTLLVQQGGTLTAGDVTLGENLGATGTFTVDGTGTTATTDDLTIGSAGQGKLAVTNGGQLTTKGDATFGEYVSADVQKGDIASDGYWNILSGLTVGGSGIATLTIESGGDVAVAGDTALGEAGAATGEIDVKGTSASSSAPSELGFGGTLTIGEAGTGTLKISAGGLVAPNPGGTGKIEIAADKGSTGSVFIDGAGSELEGTTLSIGGTEEAAGGKGMLSVSDGGLVSADSIKLWGAGTLELAGGGVSGGIDMAQGSSLSGYGTITGAIMDDGTITASGGTLNLAGTVSGTGSLSIDDGSTLDVTGAAATLDIAFGSAATHETLVIGQHADFSATLSDYMAGDVITIDDIAYAAGDSASLLSGNVLQVVYDGGAYDIQLDPGEDYSGDLFQVAAASNGGLMITEESVACYCLGTLIETERGERPVEALAIGDLVRTHSGALRPVKWIGERSYAGRFILGRKDLLPVCFEAGSLGENERGETTPLRDLWVSPHHAMLIDGVLIEAKDLINDLTIYQADRADEVCYFHIELDSHDVIVAEGAYSESFIDDDTRAMFHNAADYHALYPDEEPAEPLYCAPRINEGAALETIRNRLSARAECLASNTAA